MVGALYTVTHLIGKEVSTVGILKAYLIGLAVLLFVVLLTYPTILEHSKKKK